MERMKFIRFAMLRTAERKQINEMEYLIYGFFKCDEADDFFLIQNTF